MGKYAIIIVFTVIVSSSIYGLGLQRIWMSSDIAAVDIYNYSQARNIAQSAAMVAVRKIVHDQDPSYVPASGSTLRHPASASSFKDWPAMKGQYQQQIVNQGDTLINILSRGKFRDSEYDIQVLLEKESDEWEPEFPHSVFALSGITMTGNSRVFGHVGTNSTATNSASFIGTSRVDSNLAIGPGANAFSTVVNSGNVRGNITNLSKPMSYPMPEFPAFPAKLSTVTELRYTSTPRFYIQPSVFDNKYIGSFVIVNNSKVTLATGNVDRVLHVGNLDISGHLDVDGSGKITIYVENRITLGGTSSVNSNRSSQTAFIYYKGTNALNLSGQSGLKGGLFVESANITLTGTSSLGSGGVAGNIISGGQSVTISGNAASLGRLIYAPNAHVSLSGTAVIKGTVVSKTFFAEGDGRVEHRGPTPFPPLPPMKKTGHRGFAVSHWH